MILSRSITVNGKEMANRLQQIPPGGGGGGDAGRTSLLDANEGLPLDGVASYDWIDYNGVAFSIELLEWARTFSDSLG